MPTIAQKLCHEIVEPDIKPSVENKKNDSTGINTYFNLRKNGKPNHSVLFEKKKVSIKTEPSSVTNSNKNSHKPNTIPHKKLASSGVNTLISGPLKSHHNCLTLIHRRVNKTDKACTHCIETVSCGTQFYDNINGILKQSNRSKSNRGINIKNNTAYSSRSNVTKCHFSNENIKYYIEKPYELQPPCLRYASGKHWALSNYTTRGPDF